MCTDPLLLFIRHISTSRYDGPTQFMGSVSELRYGRTRVSRSFSSTSFSVHHQNNTNSSSRGHRRGNQIYQNVWEIHQSAWLVQDKNAFATVATSPTLGLDIIAQILSIDKIVYLICEKLLLDEEELVKDTVFNFHSTYYHDPPDLQRTAFSPCRKLSEWCTSIFSNVRALKLLPRRFSNLSIIWRLLRNE